MNFKPNHIYYLYSQTFDNVLAFPKRGNYQFFVRKLKKLTTSCELLCYCLMPDHIQLIVYVSSQSPGLAKLANGQMQILSRAIGTLLGSYAQAYNKQQRRSGSLFQPKAKSVLLNANAAECFHSVLHVPVKVGLVFQAADWEFSSYREYYGQTRGICNTELGRRLLGL